MLAREKCVEVDIGDLDWLDSSIFDRYGKIKVKVLWNLFNLEEGGTMYLDLQNVNRMDSLFSYDLIGYIKCDFRTGKGPLKGKHLVVVNPKENVLETINKTIDDLNEAFLYMKQDGVLCISGRAFDETLNEILYEVLKNFKDGRGTLASDVAPNIGKSNQACSDLLRELYDWGFVTKKEVKTGGRPKNKFFPYFPKDARYWPKRVEKIRWRIERNGEKEDFFDSKLIGSVA